MSKLFEITDNNSTPTIVHDAALYRLHVDRLGIHSVANIALHAALLSAVALDLLSIFLVALPFGDSSVYSVLKHLRETADVQLVHHLLAQILFTGILLAVIPLALISKRLLVWRSLQSWNLVGVALQVASAPYIRGCCIFSIVARITLGLCIRAAIADLTFKDAPEEEQLKALS
ncbi:hypothetical protein X943_000605 [Babesia divergens]|uniref:Uncharacterized protein n=1 Tax=Babesia divergens TaxID=32595 RepID=A0AAD9LJ39_BABDI|nr:hypothetical protein X943_000605 [Babesia divergens]